MGERESDQDISTAAIDRRKLLKRLGATSAVAWTAPVLVDSLVSPAAAVTALPGCFVMHSNVTGGTWSAWQPGPGSCATPSGGCTPVNATASQLAALNLPTPDVGNNNYDTVTVSIKPGYSCNIVAAGAYVQTGGGSADQCRTNLTPGGTGSDRTTFTPVGGASVEIDPRGFWFFGNFGDGWDPASQISVVIQCG